MSKLLFKKCLFNNWCTQNAILFEPGFKKNKFRKSTFIWSGENERKWNDLRSVSKLPSSSVNNGRRRWASFSKCRWGRRHSRRSPQLADGSTTSSPQTQKKPHHWQGSSYTQWTWHLCDLTQTHAKNREFTACLLSVPNQCFFVYYFYKFKF